MGGRWLRASQYSGPYPLPAHIFLLPAEKGSSGGDGDGDGDGEAAEAADAEPEAAQEPEAAEPEPEAAKEAETAVAPEPEAPAEPEAAKAEEPAAADEPKKEAVVEDEEELDYDDPRAKAKRKEARRLKKEAEMAANGGLTKKELKALKKKQKAEAMLNPEQPKTLEGTFDVVQRSDAGAAVIENALDITASGFSIRAAGNVLFENTTLNIANGRKYVRGLRPGACCAGCAYCVWLTWPTPGLWSPPNLPQDQYASIMRHSASHGHCCKPNC